MHDFQAAASVAAGKSLSSLLIRQLDGLGAGGGGWKVLRFLPLLSFFFFFLEGWQLKSELCTPPWWHSSTYEVRGGTEDVNAIHVITCLKTVFSGNKTFTKTRRGFKTHCGPHSKVPLLWLLFYTAFALVCSLSIDSKSVVS